MLTAAQADRLVVVVDRILPPTDTPGASDVGVPAFIDRLLAEWAEPDERIVPDWRFASCRAEPAKAVPCTENVL